VTIMQRSYALFDSDFGTCGIAWDERGALTAFQLPAADVATTEARVGRYGAKPAAPPPAVSNVIAALRAYFAGEPADLSRIEIVLPHKLPRGREAIYRATRQLGWGETASYGEIAKRAGIPNGAQAVGQAMAANPLPILIPCHRVLAAGGKLGGFSAYGGVVTKERLLTLEKTLLPF
jgi:methylated-DNA-[protein]-cysteine S-methyltransferase